MKPKINRGEIEFVIGEEKEEQVEIVIVLTSLDLT